MDPGVVSLKSLLPSKVSLSVECSLQLCDEIEFVSSVEDMQNYYTYDGSLTTPMCYESVRWIVFREKMGLSRLQVRNILIRHGRSLMSTLVSSSINYVNWNITVEVIRTWTVQSNRIFARWCRWMDAPFFARLTRKLLVRFLLLPASSLAVNSVFQSLSTSASIYHSHMIYV